MGSACEGQTVFAENRLEPEETSRGHRGWPLANALGSPQAPVEREPTQPETEQRDGAWLGHGRT